MSTSNRIDGREPWAWRCPLGHASWEPRQPDGVASRSPKSRFYCRTCAGYHDSTPHFDELTHASEFSG